LINGMTVVRRSIPRRARAGPATIVVRPLNALEAQGLVRRWREQSNRRVQRVELTDEGVALFDRLRRAATSHDRRLRAHLSNDEAAFLGELLDKVHAGVVAPPAPIDPVPLAAGGPHER
jgi:DNA-binding PadR family transcriptional regulator